MSDTMLIGVLRMPLNLWRDSELMLPQIAGRMVEAADRIETDTERIKVLETNLTSARGTADYWKDNLIQANKEIDFLRGALAHAIEQRNVLQANNDRYIWLRGCTDGEWMRMQNVRFAKGMAGLDAEIDVELLKVKTV